MRARWSDWHCAELLDFIRAVLFGYNVDACHKTHHGARGNAHVLTILGKAVAFVLGEGETNDDPHLAHQRLSRSTDRPGTHCRVADWPRRS
jgi:hypothetical protein